ncbi:ATP-binding protein [Kitasatospora sp. GP82]|uniref:ATP-binding protein n=1 Tax=Kitasatospora sp. GP82 TaxID=3035089 RepID=UPI00247359D8|nr:ATP-binding protein [Kitasatospora sp. GP82]MDH6128787.1 two-component system sensor histidine kinase KdpD [Kitasatospora sp. GP82]
MAGGGQLRVYLGAAPGVGKTYAMLAEGRRLRAGGLDVVVGLVETYGRRGTQEQLGDLPVIPRRTVHYRGTVLTELDVDALLARRPALALVDELAHTNVPGSRNTKRWQDVWELLGAGIDVATTLNIQHLESLNDVVEQITGIVQREQIPDAVARAADRIELVDLSPEALRTRMAQGEIYQSDRIDVALDNYFRAGNLGALRELALLWLADRVEEELADYRARHGIRAPWETKERIVVALNGAPQGEHLIRRGARTAARVHGDLIGVHVRLDDGTLQPEPPALTAQRALLRELHGSYVEISGTDAAQTLVDFARTESATQILLGPTSRSRLRELLTGSVINRVIRLAGPIDIRILPPPGPDRIALPKAPRRRRPAHVSARRSRAGLLLGPTGAVALAAALSPLRSSLGLSGALLFLLLLVAGIAGIGGPAPAAATTLVAALAADYFFTTPWHSLVVRHGADLASLVVFLCVAAIISHLIDALTRRSQEAARARAEAYALARLAGETIRGEGRTLRSLLAELRRVFGLDAAGILAPTGKGWHPVASSGGPLPARPEDAPFAAELDQGTVLVLVGPAIDEENTRLLGPFVTQLRLAEEHERLTREAAAAQSLARTDALHTTLLEAVAHDLRGPLAAIRTAARRLRSADADGLPGAERGDCAETIAAETDRLNHSVANLLDLSRLRAGRVPVALHPTAVGEALAAAIASLPGAAAEIVVGPTADLPPVEADLGLLEGALANVLANAQEWSPPGAAVRVDAGAVADRVDIRIIDRGPGIPPDERQRLFQPQPGAAARYGRRETGMGLGLVVAKGFVEAMHGELSVEDTPAGGATFIFSLRRAGH